MKRLVLALALVLLVVGQSQLILIGGRPRAVVTGSCTTIVNDDFTGYSDWSSQWSGQNGPFAIVSSQFVADPDGGTGVGKDVARLLTTGADDQWVKIYVVSRSVATDERGIAFRFSAGDYTGSFNTVTTNDTTLFWEKHTSTSHVGDVATSQAVTVPAAPYYMAAKVTGTGSSILVNVWLTSSDPGQCPSDWAVFSAPTVVLNSSEGGFTVGNVVDTGQWSGMQFYFPNSTDEIKIGRFVYGSGS